MDKTINGLYKTEVIWNKGSWKSISEVKYATVEWIDWFNNRRILEPIGNISPKESEMVYYERINASPKVVGLNRTVSGKPGAVHT